MKIEDRPAADLLICPVPPEGFPLDQMAVMPETVRAAAVRLAAAYGATRIQLIRFIRWESPGACPEKVQ